MENGVEFFFSTRAKKVLGSVCVWGGGGGVSWLGRGTANIKCFVANIKCFVDGLTLTHVL